MNKLINLCKNKGEVSLFYNDFYEKLGDVGQAKFKEFRHECDLLYRDMIAAWWESFDKLFEYVEQYIKEDLNLTKVSIFTENKSARVQYPRVLIIIKMEK